MRKPSRTNLAQPLGILAGTGFLAACAGAGGVQGIPEVDVPAGEQVMVAEENEPPDTPEHAKAQCWMRYERDRSAPRDLDKRLALVEQCIAEKLAERPSR